MAAPDHFEAFSTSSEASKSAGTESEELSGSLARSGHARESSGLLFNLAPLAPESSSPSPTTSQRTTGRCVIRLRDESPSADSVEDFAMPPRQRDLPIYPEPKKSGFEEALLPIARKQTLRAVARFKRGRAVMVRLDLIRAAYANCGLTHQEIGELIGKSRPTVAAALRVGPSTNLYTFCEVMNVLGLELAELFPMRSLKDKGLPERMPMEWSRGPHLKENARQLVREEQERVLVNSRRRGRGRK